MAAALVSSDRPVKMPLPMKQLNLRTTRNILMELRKLCQHPYLCAPMLEDLTLPDEEQQRRLIQASGKLAFLKVLLPKLKDRGHRVLLFSQFKIALDRIEDFLIGEKIKYLRLDGDVQQATRQKAMDAYNAPGSDYFVFLLTTRAGGVGINLATADTVIIHDPDFNPHQDLQAIARSHRYGQNKPVLVFKLMTKDSVEEQIVFKGKKKMVLDHLVVQNLHADDAEVDVDSIIMHGAKALYERDTNTDGAESGIVYTSKMVEEMIDQVEKQAEEESEVLKEKYKEQDEATARGEKKEASKEARAFGFAKIWEADQAGNGALQDQEDVDGMDGGGDDGSIQDHLEETRLVLAGRDQAIKAQENLALGKRLRAKQQPDKAEREALYSKEMEEAEAMEETPEKKKYKRKGKGKGKGKGKDDGAGYVSSDAEFALGAEESSDSDYDGSAGEEEAVLDDMGRPIIVGGMVNEQHGTKRAGKIGQPKIPVNAVPEDVGGNAVAGQSTVSQLIASPKESKKGKKAGETADEKAERKKLRHTIRGREKLHAVAANLQRAAIVAASQNPNVGTTLTAVPSNHNASQVVGAGPGPHAADQSRPAHNLVHAAVIQQGREILQWLFHILRELELPREMELWGYLCLPEMSVPDRQKVYDHIAKRADTGLSAGLHKPYFGTPGIRDVVGKFLKTGASVIPATTGMVGNQVGTAAMLASPVTLGGKVVDRNVQKQGVTQGMPQVGVTTPQFATSTSTANATGSTSAATGVLTAAPSSVQAAAMAPAPALAASTSAGMPGGINGQRATESGTTGNSQAVQSLNHASQTQGPPQTQPSITRIVHPNGVIQYVHHNPGSRTPMPAPAPAPSSARVEATTTSGVVNADSSRPRPLPQTATHAIPATQPNTQMQVHVIRPAPARTLNLSGSNGTPSFAAPSRPVTPVGSSSIDDTGKAGKASKSSRSSDARKPSSTLNTVPMASTADIATHPARDQPVEAISPIQQQQQQPPQQQPEIECPPCHKKGHAFLDCDDLPPIPELLTMRSGLLAMPQLGDIVAALESVRRMINLYRQAGYPVPEETQAGGTNGVASTSSQTDQPNGHPDGHPDGSALTQPASNDNRSHPDSNPSSTSKSRKSKKRPSLGVDLNDAIEIDDDSDRDQPGASSNATAAVTKSRSSATAKRVKVKHEPQLDSPSANQASPSKRGRPSRSQVCPICSSARYHVAAQCPEVTAGAESCKMAMKRFPPGDPLHDILERFYTEKLAEERQRQSAQSHFKAAPQQTANENPPRSSATCYFCEKTCGRTIRQCAEFHGGRKHLKDIVRNLTRPEAELEPGYDAERMEALYQVYREWPAPPR